ncbi:hypothetical protein G7046_g7735 [Stylonectria norvegica]|nr:hypothetical protein G7046_g7735 [Stylonectria norvegica]
MRCIGICLWATFLATVQAEAHGKDGKRGPWKRQLVTGDASRAGNEATCNAKTVTETLRQTITINAIGAANEANVTATETITVMVTPTAVQPADTGTDESDNVSAEKLRISFVTETEIRTVVNTWPAQTLTVKASAETVTLVVTAVADTPSANIITMTVTETTDGQAPAPVTVTETIPGTCGALIITISKNTSGGVSTSTQTSILPNNDGNGIGVSTVPIANSALPVTTLASDPMATKSSAASPPLSTFETSTSIPISVPVPVNTAAQSSVIESLATPVSGVELSTSSVTGDPSSVGTSISEPSNSEGTATTSAAVVSNTEPTSAPVVPGTSAPDTTTSGTSASETLADDTTAVVSTASPSSSPNSSLETSLATAQTSTTTGATSTGFANSLNLGDLSPDTTAVIASAVTQAPTTTSAPFANAPVRSPIDISSLSLSSVLNLGNLLGAAVPSEPRTTRGA